MLGERDLLIYKLSIKEALLDERINMECDDVSPRWARWTSDDKKVKIVMFESIGKGDEPYQELSYLDLNKKTLISIVKSKATPLTIEPFEFPSEEENNSYAGYISWIPIGTVTEWTSSAIFNKGNELDTYSIPGSQPFSVLSLEKNVVEGIIFLRAKGTNTLFYLSENGKIAGTSTEIKNESWESVVNTNSDCSTNKDVVFCSTIAGTDGDLYIFKLTQLNESIVPSMIKRVTFDNGMEINPKWSPDGKDIVYSYYKDNNMDIYLLQDIVNNEGIKPVQLTTTTTTYECNPTFSPDGKMIAFYVMVQEKITACSTMFPIAEGVGGGKVEPCSFNSNKDDKKYELWVMDVTGENKRKIADSVCKTDIYRPRK